MQQRRRDVLQQRDIRGYCRTEEECTIAKIHRNVVLQRGMMCSSREERCTEVRRRGSKEELEGYCRKEEECTIAMIHRNRLLQRGRMCCSREERCTGARSRMHCSKEGGMCCNKEKLGM